MQALPVLRMLKRHLPDSAIYWWVDAHLSPLLEGDADLAGLYLFHREGWASPRCWIETSAGIREMRDLRFDWVIDLQALARSAVVAWFVRGAITVGLDDAREGAVAFYDLRVPRASPDTHAVDWYLGVLRPMGVPLCWDFQWLPARPRVAEHVREKWRIREGRWIVLHPGARWLNKRWPVAYYAELTRRLARDLPEARFAVLGGETERELGVEIQRAAPDRCVDLTGRTTLIEVVEWLRHAEVVVTNDSGPMHIAAALGKEIVALFGPTDPSRTGPYGLSDGVLRSGVGCAPCMKSRCRNRHQLECLERIAPERVQAEVLSRWRDPVRGAEGQVGWRIAACHPLGPL